MILKENFTPATYDRFCYNLAPWLAAVPVLLVFAVVPFGGTLMPGKLFSADLFPGLAAFFGDRSYTMQVAQPGRRHPVRAGHLGHRHPGHHAGGLVIEQQVLDAGRGARRLADDFLRGRDGPGPGGHGGDLRHAGPEPHGAVAAAGCLGHLRAADGLLAVPHRRIAENKRVPFDLPECESELVSGYFTEYTSMKMGLFLLSEFIEIVVISGLVATLFFGGYSLPWMHDAALWPGGSTWDLPHIVVVLLQCAGLHGEGLHHRLLPDPGALDAAALPLRPADGAGLEVPAAAWRRPTWWSRPSCAGDPMSEPPVKRVKKKYWNEPTMGLWERSYILEIVRGLMITGKVFCCATWASG
jgi:NADH-quinone oxidoreductase subunit H